MARIRIESDGSYGCNAKVTNMETGELIPHMKEVIVSIKAGTQRPTATLAINVPVVDVVAEADIHTICPHCGQEIALSEKREETQDEWLTRVGQATLEELKYRSGEWDG